MTPELPAPIAANIAHFTGRTWLLPHLRAWFERSSARMFILTGAPGTGKSMLTAWLAGAGSLPTEPDAARDLAQVRAMVKATHFCVAESGSTAPRALAENLANQLTSSVPGFAAALTTTLKDRVQIIVEQHVGTVNADANVTGLKIEHFDVGVLSDDPATFDQLVRTPLRHLYARGVMEPVLLLIDALDEARTYPGRFTIVELLSHLADLPAPVRILVTTRPDPEVLKYFRELKPFDLLADAPHDVDDVRAYLCASLAGRDGNLAEEARTLLVDRINEAAHGNFLYAHMVLYDLLSRLPDLPDLTTQPLPDGLRGLYQAFLLRELGRDTERWQERFEPVLGLLAVAQGDGLRRSQLEQIIGQDVRLALRLCLQYLSGDLPEGPFRPFHRSFVDFLLDDTGNVDYHIDARVMHRCIADFYQDPLRWAPLDSYASHHLSSHLRLAGDYLSLIRLVDDRAWYQAQLLVDPTEAAYAHDVEQAWRMAESTGRENTMGDQPLLIAHEFRFALILASLNSLSTKVPDAAILGLVRTGIWSVSQASTVVRRMSGRQRRDSLYIALAVMLIHQNDPAGALMVTRLIEDRAERAATLGEIVPALPLTERAAVRSEVVAAAARLVTDASRNARALAWVAPALAKAGAVTKAVEVAHAINDTSRRVEVLVQVAAALAMVGNVTEALSVARAIKAAWARAKALRVIAPTLPPPEQAAILTEALVAARVIHGASSREPALAQIAVALTKAGNVAEALAVTRTIRAASRRAQALTLVAPALPPSEQAAVLTEALAAARAIEAVATRADALMAVAPALSPPEQAAILTEALVAARAVKATSTRERELARLAPLLAEAGNVAEAVAAARAVENTFLRAQALTLVASALPPSEQAAVLTEALAAARALRAAWARAKALRVIAPTLPPPEQAATLTEALVAAHTIDSASMRAEALARVAPLLAKAGNVTEAVAAVHAIDDADWRARALTWIASSVMLNDAAALTEALAAARAIDDASIRDQTLAHVALALATGNNEADAVAAAQVINYTSTRSKPRVPRSKPRAPRAKWAAPEVTVVPAGFDVDAYIAAVRVIDFSGPSDQFYPQVAAALATAGHVADAVALARAINDSTIRDQAFVQVATALSIFDVGEPVGSARPPDAQVHHSLNLLLRAVAGEPRTTLLKCVPPLLPLLAQYGGRSTIMEMAKAINEVGARWP